MIRTVTVEVVVDTSTAQGAVELVEAFMPDVRDILSMESLAVVCVTELVPRTLRVEDGKVQGDDENPCFPGVGVS